MACTDDDLKRLKTRGTYQRGDGTGCWIRADQFQALLARLEAAEKAQPILDDIQYCLQNIWALDRKKFEAEFLGRIIKVLEDWRKAAGK